MPSAQWQKSRKRDILEAQFNDVLTTTFDSEILVALVSTPVLFGPLDMAYGYRTNTPLVGTSVALINAPSQGNGRRARLSVEAFKSNGPLALPTVANGSNGDFQLPKFEPGTERV